MPREPIDYSNTIIYKIVCKDLSKTDVYVGHTTDFRTRKGKHKSNCYNVKEKHYNIKVYQYIRENGGWDNFDMIEIEKYSECKDANEARKRERYWYEELNAKLNSVCPIRTQKELIEYKKEYKKEYYEVNKDEKLKKDKEYKKINKEHIIQKSKEYYEENRNKILEYQTKLRNTEYICECGWIGNYSSKSQHLRISKYHKEYLETIK